MDSNNNLVDSIWTGGRLKENNWKAENNAQYGGKNWLEKITEVRRLMKASKANALVLTDPNEISWLFNVRAEDLRSSIYLLVSLRAYAVIEKRTATLFIDENKLSTELKEVLNTESCATLTNSKCVE